MLERGLAEELTEHVGYEVGDPAAHGTGNSRNGYTSKRLITEAGTVGMTVPDIQTHLLDTYEVDVSPGPDLNPRGLVLTLREPISGVLGCRPSPDCTQVDARTWPVQGTASGVLVP